jgi:hypothetical protein
MTDIPLSPTYIEIEECSSDGDSDAGVDCWFDDINPVVTRDSFVCGYSCRIM